MRSILKLTLACAAVAALAPSAWAGNGPNGYPDRPVTLVVPFAPGGGSDNIARLIATRLGERMGGTVVVENRPGGGTNIGNQAVARMKPDGYGLLFGQVTLAINPHVYEQLPYSVEKDFTPVAQIANSPTVLLVNPSLGLKTVADFVTYVKSMKGAINYGSGGVGTSVHLAGHLFGSIAGLDMTHVAYRGSGPAIVDLIGGSIQAMFDTAPSALAQVNGGKLQALAVTGKERLQALPDVPTFAQAGYPTFDAPAWYGIVAPTGTPPEVITYLNQEVNEILAEPRTQTQLLQLGSVVAPGSAQDFGRFMAAESERWRAAVASAQVVVN